MQLVAWIIINLLFGSKIKSIKKQQKIIEIKLQL